MTSILILQHQRPDGEVDTYHLKAGRRYHLGRGSQCQVRILDLKLSRQHCAFEHADQGWMLVDLASTNGCTVDGERVAGTTLLHSGANVAAGSTQMQVARITDTSEEPAAAAAPPPAPPPPSEDPTDSWPEQAEAEPPQPSDRLAAAAARSAASNDDLEPQAVPSRAMQSDPLIPSTPPVAPAPPPREPAPPPIPLDHDVLATLPPGRSLQMPSSEAPADSGTRSFYINVLGRRVGPLSKAQARELKTKELKGTLTPADLASLEAEASLGLPPQQADGSAPAGGSADEQRTYYVTLLGQRVGPLNRSQARELKARELRGVLTADEIERLVIR